MWKYKIKNLIVLLFILLFVSGCNYAVSAQTDNEVSSETVVLKELPGFAGEQPDGVLVKVFVNKDDIIYGFEVSGHTGYAEKGSDIVCAGLSVIAQNTLLSIQLYTKDKVESSIDDGYLKCILPNMKNNIGSKEACVLLKSAIAGFYSLESTYGSECVSVFKIVE